MPAKLRLLGNIFILMLLAQSAGYLVSASETLAVGVEASSSIRTPTVADARLALELFASEPAIVTPTDIAVDGRGGVLVVENHTHFRPRDYEGPEADRIRRFEDSDDDGRADRITTFFEGSTDTMNLAVERDGAVLVVSRNELFRLRDDDGDGKAEKRTRLVHMETADTYPHAGLAGVAIEANGDICFGLGENHAVPFKLFGSDGRVESDAEGGHVYRCRPDGSGLERICVGLWNAHAMAIDRAGRLLAVDNDPDSLPPCRLLHVVPGADFGYKYRNGRRGTHPFTSWDGQMPGTLPMVCGTGEAPSDIYVCGNNPREALPSDYRGDLLVTSWGDHRIERYRPRRRGASLAAERIDLVVGGENFRPVGIARGGDGAIYVTDWVDKSYKLHGKGRIWRLRAKFPEKPAPQGARPRTPPFEAALSAAEQRAQRLRAAGDRNSAQQLWMACDDVDPFIRQAAWEGLRRSGVVDASIDLEPLGPMQRLGALVALRAMNSDRARERLPEFLADDDTGIRLAALKWAGEEELSDHREALDRVLTAGPMTRELFAAYIAAQERLTRGRRLDKDEISHADYVAEALAAESTPPEARRWALRSLPPSHAAITRGRLQAWIDGNDEALRLEAVRTLRESTVDGRDEMLWSIAADDAMPVLLRCEALVGIHADSAESKSQLVELARGTNADLAREALRALRSAKLTADDRNRLLPIAEQNAEMAELVSRVLPDETGGLRPSADDIDRWMALLEGPADAAAGERVFFHAKSGACARCHQMEGRGADIGPDLTTAGKTLDRRRLVESIVRPSQEIAPQFVVSQITTTDGRQLRGMLVGESVDGRRCYVDANGREFRLRFEQIDLHDDSPVSLMPEGLPSQMTLQEFRDLLAYLQQQADSQ